MKRFRNRDIDAAEKAIAFIRRQMDVNNFKHRIAFAEPYDDSYSGNVVWGMVTGLSDDYDQVNPKYIAVPAYYGYEYTGKVSGTWHGLSDMRIMQSMCMSCRIQPIRLSPAH